jgi:hypothetical protein
VLDYLDRKGVACHCRSTCRGALKKRADVATVETVTGSCSIDDLFCGGELQWQDPIAAKWQRSGSTAFQGS